VNETETGSRDQTPSEETAMHDRRFTRHITKGPYAVDPLGDHLLLRRWPPQTQTDGSFGAGIVLPDVAQRDINVAWIWRIGPDVPPGLFEVGETVVLPAYAGTDLPGEIVGDRMLLVRYKDLLGRVLSAEPPSAE